MPEVLFYQTNREQEFVLRQILSKSYSMGWRILVKGTKQYRIEHLDEYLWKVPEDGFLPHGLAGEDFDEMQPILLTSEIISPEFREALVLIDGARPSSKEVEGAKRISVVFESRDQEAVRAARSLWKSLSEKGIPLVYWSEDEGGWVKKASA